MGDSNDTRTLNQKITDLLIRVSLQLITLIEARNENLKLQSVTITERVAILNALCKYRDKQGLNALQALDFIIDDQNLSVTQKLTIIMHDLTESKGTSFVPKSLAHVSKQSNLKLIN